MCGVSVLGVFCKNVTLVDRVMPFTKITLWLTVSFRAGSSELVLDQVLYFADVVSSFQPSHLSERTECKVISLFLRRMCSFLSTKGKQMLIDRFPPSEHPLMWHVFGLGSLSKEMWSTVFHSLISSSSSSIQNFLSSNYSVTEYNKMVHHIA